MRLTSLIRRLSEATLCFRFMATGDITGGVISHVVTISKKSGTRETVRV